MILPSPTKPPIDIRVSSEENFRVICCFLVHARNISSFVVVSFRQEIKAKPQKAPPFSAHRRQGGESTMAVHKCHDQRDGRIYGSSPSPSPSLLRTTKSHPFSTTTRYHGPMAPSFARKNLVCFYCNKKSPLKYDGSISQWDCKSCEATNYLDEV